MLNALSAVLLLAPTLHVRVEGEGYMRFAHEGRVVYAASAQLAVMEGRLSHSAGAPLLPTVRIPDGAAKVEVDLEGRISVDGVSAGRVVLALFPAEARLTRRGSFLIASSRPTLGSPGEDMNGVIRVESGLSTSRAGAETRAASPALRRAVVGGTLIRIAKESECAGDRILLSEIARVEAEPSLAKKLERLDMGPAPAIGAARALDQRQVLARLRQAGFNPETIAVEVPGGALVRRKSQTVSADEFTEAAVRAARRVLGDVPLVASASSSEFRAPLGELDLVAESVTPTGSGATVVVAVLVNGQRFNARSIRVSISPTASVKANTPVTIVMRSGGAVVELRGKTRAASHVGQSVTVQSESGAEMTGVLAAPDRVEIKL